MVVFNIDVKIKEQGSASVQSGLKNLQKTADRVDKKVSALGRRVKVDRITAFNRELKKTGDTAKGVRRVLTQLFGAIGVGVAIREIAQMADTYQNFQNRLKLVTTDTANLKDVTEELFRTANETRSSFAGTAELFTRVSIATKNLGRSQKEVIDFTSTLNKAVILSGTTAAEAKNGIIQLSQGLASGALRGDELRSVLEQLPAVAQAIANSMGITRGKLREMGEQGKITADIVIDAMAKAANKIDADFAGTIPTISQSFQVLGNEVTKMIGGINEASGIFSSFASGILLLAQNIETIIKVLAALALGFIAVKVQARLAGVSVVGFAAKAKLAIATISPLVAGFGFLAVGAAELTDWLTKSTSALDALEAKVAKMTEMQKLEANFERMNMRLAAWRVEINKGVKQSDSMKEAFLKLDLAVFDLHLKIKGLKDGTTAATNAQKAHNEAVGDSKASLKEQLRLAFMTNEARQIEIATLKEIAKVEKQGGGKVTPDEENSIKLRVQALALVTSQTAAIEALTEKEDTRKAKLRELDAIERLRPDLINQITAARERLNAVPQKELTPPAFNEGLQRAVDHIKALQRAADGMGQSAKDALEGKMLASLVKNAEGADTLRQGVQRIRDTVAATGGSAALADMAIKKLFGPNESEEFFQQLDDLNLKLKEGNINAYNYRQQVRDIGPEGQKGATLMADGFTKAFNRMRDEANDLKKVGNELVELFADKAVEAIHTLATEGSLDFKAFAADVLKQIARIIIRLLVVKALSTLGDAYTGGAASAVTTAADAGISASQQTEARANGGPIEQGRPYLVGEEGPELVVPNQSGTVIPNGALGAQAPQAPPEVNVSVINVTDPNELPSAVDSGEHDQTFINLIARNGEQIRQAIQQS